MCHNSETQLRVHVPMLKCNPWNANHILVDISLFICPTKKVICKINKHAILKIGIYYIFIKIVQIWINFTHLKLWVTVANTNLNGFKFKFSN